MDGRYRGTGKSVENMEPKSWFTLTQVACKACDFFTSNSSMTASIFVLSFKITYHEDNMKLLGGNI